MIDAVSSMGRVTRHFVRQLGQVGVFASRILTVSLKPPLRLRLFVDEVYKLGVLSLVIICVCGLAVGMVLGLQGYNTLVRFGAEEALGAMVGLSLVRELGPVLTALLAAGRAGSAISAEIGTMVVTEQLDGLRMMSVDPVDYVVRPRALAMTFVMPLLGAIFICAGLIGGYVVGVGRMGLTTGMYMTSLESSIDFSTDVAGGLLKTLVFGLLVGLIATYRGYTSEPTSAGVSAATTSTVVISSVSILISDYFITALWGV
ncbi:MAG: MlaE family lipid ABC transporter permease subunit [Candidatus Binatia bacterium]